MAKVSKSANGKVQLPKGWKAITGGGNSWKPAKSGESIEGVMLGSKVVSLPKNGRIPARDVNVYTVKTKDADVDVWQSGGLKALEKIKKGKPVYIQFLGMKKIKGQAQPMREYLVATK